MYSCVFPFVSCNQIIVLCDYICMHTYLCIYMCSTSRVLVGTFMAFDRHMNIVLGDTEEYRKIKSKKGSGITEEREEKRVLGLIILRGDSVVSLTIEGPPPPELNEKLTPGGPGVSKLSAGRGIPVMNAPSGLGGPVRGVGGPGLGIMQPPTQGRMIIVSIIISS